MTIECLLWIISHHLLLNVIVDVGASEEVRILLSHKLFLLLLLYCSCSRVITNGLKKLNMTLIKFKVVSRGHLIVLTHVGDENALLQLTEERQHSEELHLEDLVLGEEVHLDVEVGLVL